MTTFYKINNIPFEDYFVRKELFSSGGLWLWGESQNGQLGADPNIDRSSPVQSISGTDWKVIASGWQHTGGIKTNGSLWMWGSNSSGELGIGITEYARSNPTQVGTINNWKSLACGTAFSAGIKSDGSLWLWGGNNNGELGIDLIGASGYRSSPVQTTVGGNNWRSVSCGFYHTAATKIDGTIWAWGHGGGGRLGDGTVSWRSTPTQIGTDTNWKLVDCGYYHTMALKTDNTLWGWGEGAGIGNNSVANRSSPVQLTGTNWKSISCGSNFSAGIKTDGTLWCWGYNDSGQLGKGNVVNSLIPVQTSAVGTNWKLISCNGSFSAAIKTDGTLWMWGGNNWGQLGTNDTVNKSNPVQIGTGDNWVFLSCGDIHTVAIRD